MNAFARKLSLGLASLVLTVGTAGVSSAQPFPWPHHHHHYLPYRPVVVTPVVSPVVYRPTVVVPANPVISAPAAIQLVNPLQNQVALTYRLNSGIVQVLPAGGSVSIYRESVIEFDRGGAAGLARYGLTSGAYKFVPVNGHWTLVQEATSSIAVAAPITANPVAPQ
jgi:hypothetical protein